MTRAERASVAIVAGLAAALVAALVSGLATTLNGVAWFSGGANLIQWTSGVSTFATVAAGVMLYLNRTCAASKWCFRFGEHPVGGTLAKVCDHHHRLECHEIVHARLGGDHRRSGRLERGQTHARVN